MLPVLNEYLRSRAAEALDLIEIVLSRGGWIALLPPRHLPEGTHWR